jgi:hypothetical protein
MCGLVLNVSRVVAELVRCEDAGEMCFRGAELVVASIRNVVSFAFVVALICRCKYSG